MSDSIVDKNDDASASSEPQRVKRVNPLFEGFFTEVRRFYDLKALHVEQQHLYSFKEIAFFGVGARLLSKSKFHPKLADAGRDILFKDTLNAEKIHLNIAMIRLASAASFYARVESAFKGVNFGNIEYDNIEILSAYNVEAEVYNKNVEEKMKLLRDKCFFVEKCWDHDGSEKDLDSIIEAWESKVYEKL